MPLSRRDFMHKTALAAGGLALTSQAHAGKDVPMNADRPLFVSTWSFGKEVNEEALATFETNGSVLDAVERGIHVAEADADNASVGSPMQPGWYSSMPASWMVRASALAVSPGSRAFCTRFRWRGG